MTMILILLALIVPSSADPSDYFIFKIEFKYENYKIFTKISKCKGEVYYQSEDSRVLFQDEVWKIGTLENELDCNKLSSDVEEEYRTTEKQIPKDHWWIDIKKTNSHSNNNTHFYRERIWIEGFLKRVETKGLKLVGGTNVDAKSKEDCFKKDWVDFSPDKDIVVAFQDFRCFYNFVDEAELEVETWRTAIFVHPAGKN